MKTKDKIIAKAIEMYNISGITNVSSRDVSKELGISHGNLEYHFKNKTVLLNAIYEKMSEDISHVYRAEDMNIDPLEHFQNLLNELEKLQETYSFFNLDVIEIARKYPEVKLKLDSTLHLRKNQTAVILSRFIDSAYFKPEIEQGYYQRLQHVIRILITFWKSQEEILVSFSSAKTNEMSQHIWDLLIPHMTEKGYEVYLKLIKE